jgi:hypothetical protein
MGSRTFDVGSALLPAVQLALGFLGDLRSRHTQSAGDLDNGQEAGRVLSGLVAAVLRPVKADAIRCVLLAQAKALPRGAQDVADDPILRLR